VRFKLICPSRSEVWQHPENEGFDRAEIVRLLDELPARGHTYEIVDGDALTAQQRSALYGDAMGAVMHGRNRYRIRQVYGSRRHGGGDFLGSNVPALLVYEDSDPVAVYPHQVGDGYETIRAYLTRLVAEPVVA
jgi:hypothetical protein